MKLLTYNFLTSKCIRGVQVGYPLKLNVSFFCQENRTDGKQHTTLRPHTFYPLADCGVKSRSHGFQFRIHHTNVTSIGMECHMCCSDQCKISKPPGFCQA
ncbi:AGAP006575-PA-like protein [Anopheles sinensis]|uniref:AGAP006575-PA-like protein n=1 Tax=Anopheles sinensis TaxID=74873 RepID=A0A084WMQ7_ANOSI|nr:AGAP006575-PA-like protein [Anopheles sinensis]